MPDQQTPQKSRWRTVKVFISSTFRDMYAERDHLVKVVFPALREKLGKYRVHLIDIDLRWGVTKEQADNDRVLDLCLDLIDDCRPFFIGILGERYGWVPTKIPPEAIRKYGWVQHATGKSLTELEILHGVLNNPDMKGHAFFYFRDPKALNKIPDAVRKEIYVESDPVRIKKLIALKEEIRRSGHPVMDPYPARWDAKAYDRYTKAKGRLTGLEEFGNKIQKQLWERIKGELKLPETPPIEAETDPLAIEQDYHERFIDSRLTVYIGRDKIHKDLLAYCNGDDRKPLIVTGPSGSGKSAILARLSRELMETKTPSPLPSPTRGEGCNISPPLRGENKGKSDVCGSTNEHVSNTTVIPFFVGASPSSTAIRGALQYLCNVIKKEFGLAPEIPAEADKLITTFRSFLFSIPENKRLVIIIDAINQLDETGHPEELAWLPEELAPNVRIVLSCINEFGHKNRFIERVREMKIAEKSVDELTDDERMEIIRKVPSVSAKTLDKNQIKMLLENPATKNPLYLLIALEELRGFGSFDELNRRISEFPKPDIYPVREGEVSNGDQGGDVIQAIFGQVIRRLEEEFDRELISTVLPMLASARRGLSEKELSELIVDLSGKGDIFPVLRQLRSYLMERGEIIDFFHRGLYKAIHSLYLKDDDARKAYHLKLADYFNTLELFPLNKGGEGVVPNARKVDELPWQLCRADCFERLYAVFANPEFFKYAWDINESDVLGYWVQIEQYTPLRVVQAYAEMIKQVATDWGILFRMTELLDKRGNTSAAQEAYQILEDHFLAINDLSNLQACVGNEGFCLLKLGKLETALAKFREQEQIAHSIRHDAGLINALTGQATVLREQDKTEAALSILTEGKAIIGSRSTTYADPSYIGAQGVVLSDQGEFNEAMTKFREQEHLIRMQGRRDELAVCLGNMAAAAKRLGNLKLALTYAKEQEQLARKMGMSKELLRSLDVQAGIAVKHQEWDAALALYREQEPLCHQLSEVNQLFIALTFQAAILGQQYGRYAEALPLAEQAFQIARQLGLEKTNNAWQMVVAIRHRL